MTIKTKFAAVAVAALVATGSIASTTTSAEAHGFHPGWAIGAGILGAAVIGSAVAASQPYPYYGYARCGYVRQFDAWGRPYLVRTCY
jgi:hypothetical protein